MPGLRGSVRDAVQATLGPPPPRPKRPSPPPEQPAIEAQRGGMPRHSRLTLVNIAFQYAQTCLLIVNGIVLTPLYLACIPERTFGAWLATGNIVAWLTLIDPGINQVVQQRVAAAHAREDRAALGRLRTQ